MASLGSTPGLIIAAGVGAAASVALEPAFEVPRQEAWARLDNRLLDVGTIARLVAAGGVELGEPGNTDGATGYGSARRTGYSPDRLDRLIWLAQKIPEWGQVRDLTNRKLIDRAARDEALTRLGYPPDWQARLVELMQAILPPEDLARAIHRGLIPDPGLLQGTLPSAVGKVPAYPVYPIPAIETAEGWGYTHDMLGVLVGLQGLPMGPHEAAQALFRGVIDGNDYLRAIAEGNTRNEWAAAIREQTRQIPTARDFFENALRGYRSLAAAIEGASLHGMSAEHGTMIYQNQGRPMAVRQITQALARGGVFRPEPGEITDPYEASIVEGNLKPGYYDLAKALRYTLPSPFVMRSLAQTGVWTETKTATRLKWAGWIPEDADEAAAAWAGASTAPKSPWIGKAETQLWTAIHKAYVKDDTVDYATAESALTQLIDDAGERADVMALWTAEKTIGTRTGPPA